MTLRFLLTLQPSFFLSVMVESKLKQRGLMSLKSCTESRGADPWEPGCPTNRHPTRTPALTLFPRLSCPHPVTAPPAWTEQVWQAGAGRWVRGQAAARDAPAPGLSGPHLRLSLFPLSSHAPLPF